MKDDPVFKVLTSLWVTVVLLAFSLFIIFFGTMAQEPMGLNIAVDRFFKSWFIDSVAMRAGIVKTAELFGAQWTPVSPEQILGSGGLPVFPGGYLVGSLLLINLVAAYIARFEWSAKKAGIFCSHLGVIVLLFSQLFTDILAVESFVSMERGDRRNYTVSFDDNELAFMLQQKDKAGVVVSNRVVSIPEPWLNDKKAASHPQLGKLKIETEKYWVNAKLMTAAHLIDWDGEQQKEQQTALQKRLMDTVQSRISAMEAKLDKSPDATKRDRLTSLKGVVFEFKAKELQSGQLNAIRQIVGELENSVLGIATNQTANLVSSTYFEKHLKQFGDFEEQREFGSVLKELMERGEVPRTEKEFVAHIDDFVAKVEQFPNGISPEMKQSVQAFSRRLKTMSGQYATHTTKGRLGGHYGFVRPLRPAFSQNDRNLPAAVIKISEGDTNHGTWLVSGSVDFIQTLKAGDETWKIILRAKRHYLDFHLTLVDLKHEKYRGTEIPKNFQSRVIVEDDDGTRPVDIYMNNPLRKGGNTFYQYQMNQNQLGATVQTMLQVVKNPNWITAYVGCAIVSIGLLYQFIYHLIGFARRRMKTEA